MLLVQVLQKNRSNRKITWPTFQKYFYPSLKKNPVIRVYGKNYNTKDGTCIRDYIHVSDLADIHVKCINYLFEKKNPLHLIVDTVKVIQLGNS